MNGPMLLFQKGELRKRALQKNLLSEALNVSHGEGHTDLEIITLKQWLSECAYGKAWEITTNPKKVIGCAENLLATEFTHAQEFVRITHDRIQVGVNVSEIDDNAVDRALVLLSQVDELVPESIFHFGKEVRINGPQYSQT